MDKLHLKSHLYLIVETFITVDSDLIKSYLVSELGDSEVAPSPHLSAHPERISHLVSFSFSITTNILEIFLRIMTLLNLDFSQQTSRALTLVSTVCLVLQLCYKNKCEYQSLDLLNSKGVVMLLAQKLMIVDSIFALTNSDLRGRHIGGLTC